MALIPNEVGDMLASCGESGFLELWNMKEGGHLQHEQILSTPAQSTWCVLALTNGDIATGAEYVFVFVLVLQLFLRRKCVRKHLHVNYWEYLLHL